MNILYLHTHDTGRYIQPYGCGLPTPHLQQLAQEGTLFRQAYCTGPTCSPSRAGLLTGTMPHTNGMWGLAHRGFALFHPETHMAAWFAAHGYESVLCGIQHEAEDPLTLGYQMILGDADYSMGKCKRDWESFDLGNARAAADYLGQKHTAPFFLSMGLFNTHRVFPEVTDPNAANYVATPPQICDTPENRMDMAGFIQSLQTADQAAGIVLDALKQSGRDRDTIVIFTTDHGLAFPDMKCTLYDSGIGISLIVKYPGNPMAGSVSDALVSHLDLYPTLCEMTGVPKPEGLQGVSLCPLLEKRTEAVRRSIFAEVNFHVAYEPMRCIRTARYKYIRRYSAYERPVPCNCDDSPDKSLRLEAGFYRHTQPRRLLFDLVCDPLERVNRIDDPDYSQVASQMELELEQWLEQSGDPIRRGIMFPPETALVNYPDSLSPAEKVFLKDFHQLV